jgi:glycosyltransferase involved in cell wall biosynthesis
MEALLMQNPIISTNCGGIHEYLDNTKDAFLPAYTMVPLRNNTRNQKWYTKNQNWADIDLVQLKYFMRNAFENKKKAKQVGINGSKTVREKFSLNVVGNLMKKRLEEIQAKA